MADAARQLGCTLVGGEGGERVSEVAEVGGEFAAGAAAFVGFGNARGGDAGDKGGVLDEALVTLAGEEGVRDGGFGADGLGGEEGVDLAGDALGAEGAGGRFFEGGGEGGL